MNQSARDIGLMFERASGNIRSPGERSDPATAFPHVAHAGYGNEADFLALARSLAWRDDDLPPSMGAAAPITGRLYGTLAFGRNCYGCPTDRKVWTLYGLDPHVVIRLKRAFPKISATETKSFIFPDTPEACADLQWFLARYPMAISAEDRDRLAAGAIAFGDRRDQLERILLPNWQPGAAVGFKPGFVPKPNQARGAAMAALSGRLLVADDVGLGKTETALLILAAARDGASSGLLPAAVVVEAHLATQWEERIALRTYLTTHIIAGTQPYDLPARDVYIFRYSNIAGWIDIGAKGIFRSIVFDEIQSLRNGEGVAKGRAAMAFAQPAAMRIGLSATPIFNYGSEIFHVMEFIEPGCLGNWEEFFREWCSFDGTGAVKDPEALGTYLREKHLMIREVRAGGKVNTIVHHVAYDDDVAAEFADLARALAVKVTTGSFVERGQAARELDMMARHATGVAKARHVAAFVRILLEACSPVVLAGWHRDVYEIWLRDLADFKPVMYTGSETAAHKNEAKRAFEAGETDLFIISLRSGAGLDGLQKRCSTVVIGELDWSPKVHDQLIGRLDRPGQPTDEVTAIYCVADEGADPLIVDVLALKASQSHAIMDPLSMPARVHSDQSRIKTLAELYLRGKGAGL